MEAVVLAGGLGTRLKGVIGDIPKPMAPVGGRPFLEILLDYLISQGVESAVLAVCYRWNMIKEHFGGQYRSVSLSYSVEEQPLGTGGAIKQAISLCKDQTILAMNGDTYFKIDVNRLAGFYKARSADIAIALKRSDETSRYGCASLDENGRVSGFYEKSGSKADYINGGVYLFDKELFSKCDLPDKFSFEHDFMEKHLDRLKMYGLSFENDFSDIGTPNDYAESSEKIKANGY